MKNLITLCLIFSALFINAQEDFTFGEKFEFITKIEKNPKLVLQDNYNHYMVSNTNQDGMQASHVITVRKFDQKLNLIDTFNQNFTIDLYTYHNYHGSYELDNNKVVTFIESYSGKRKVAEIFAYIFDKTTSSFTTKLIASYPIISAGKTGSLSVSRSQNSNYFAIVYQKYNSKKEPEENDCMFLDGHTLNQIWQKTVTFQDEFYSGFKVATNNGKIVNVRYPRSYKETNYLTIIDEKGQENKTFDEKTAIQKPIAVSIGTKDYLIAFNYNDKGVRSGNYSYIMFYDIEQGKALFNNKVEGFGSKDTVGVDFTNVIAESNEFKIFTESKEKVDIKPVMNSGSFGGGYPEDKFNFGPSALLIFSNEGELKNTLKIPTNESNREADLYHSFGVINIKGDFYLNTGLYNVNSSVRYGFSKLSIKENTGFSAINFNYLYPDTSYRSVNQLMNYKVDTNKIMLARTTAENQMYFYNMNLPK